VINDDSSSICWCSQVHSVFPVMELMMMMMMLLPQEPLLREWVWLMMLLLLFNKSV